MPDYNPSYIPSGPNNRQNDYYQKYNNVRISRSQETREAFIGGAPPPQAIMLVPASAIITAYQLEGVDYKAVRFDASASFVLDKPVTAFCALAAGGGTGGSAAGGGTRCGGGGAGQVTPANPNAAQAFPAGSYNLTIGAGAVHPKTTNGNGVDGNPSALTGPLALSSAGGGGGGGNTAGGDNGRPGGNGGGGVGRGTSRGVGGIGAQNNGGDGLMNGSTDYAGAGGGGAGGPGVSGASTNVAGSGGPGVTLNFLDPPLTIAGGGGGMVGGPGGSGGGTQGLLVASDNATTGSGSGASQAGTVGNGGNGLFIMAAPAALLKPVNYLSALYLDEPEIGTTFSIVSRSPNALSFDAVTASRRYISWQRDFPAGTRVQFDVTTPINFYVRTSDNPELGPSGISDLVSGGIAGGSAMTVDVTIAANQVRAFFGFLTATNGATISITNFRVTLP